MNWIIGIVVVVIMFFIANYFGYLYNKKMHMHYPTLYWMPELWDIGENILSGLISLLFVILIVGILYYITPIIGNIILGWFK